MANLTKGYTFGATEEVTATKLHTLVDSGTVSNIVAADITDGVITDAKLVSVGGAKFVTLASIPAGAGDIPSANLDGNACVLTGDQTVAGIKTFSSIPVLPASDPTADNEAVRRAYYGAIPIPATKGGTGSTAAANAASGVVVLNASSQLPAVSGALLTNLPVTNTSNVIFCWNGCNDAASNYGISETKVASTFTGRLEYISGWMINTGAIDQIILRSKFTKIAGISTLTFYAYMSGDGANTGTNLIGLNITVTGATALLLTRQSTTLDWTSGTIDVSGLTNGTAYDMTFGVKRTGTSNDSWCNVAAIIGIAS